MNEIINIKDYQLKRKRKNVESAEIITKGGVEAMLHSYMQITFQLMIPIRKIQH